MLTYRKLLTSFRDLDLADAPVIVHSSLSSFGQVQGGAESVIGALTAAFTGVIMPTFTYKTMITPERGPSDNGINYGSGHEQNMLAEFYRPGMPADILMGIVPETLRQLPNAIRSIHPIYSFSGINADDAIKAQTLDNPFGPIETLTNNDGWVLLIGVDHTANTSIHYGEQLAGRKQFVRWALTPQGIISCPRWPGCSNGFNQIQPYIESVTKLIMIGQAEVKAYPLKDLISVVKQLINENPLALICEDMFCERCAEVRKINIKH
jgi:aminoglycoside 3-N-acetyltransferase